MEHDYEEKRKTDAINERLVRLLSYFEEHKEVILESIKPSIKLKELISWAVAYAAIMLGIMLFLIDMHGQHPHKDAVNKGEFTRAMNGHGAAIRDLGIKVDRLFERGK